MVARAVRIGSRGPRFRPDAVSARALLCGLAAATGLAVTILCFYPGYMWYDTISHLREARSGYFSDLAPPVMTLTWRVLDRLPLSPLGILVFHNLLFWSGLGLLAYLCRGPLWLIPIIVFGVGFSPPVFGVLGVLVKDVGMGSALLLGYVCLHYAGRTRCRTAFLIAVSALFYAAAGRHNAAPAVLPLALVAGAVGYRLLPLRSVRPTLVMLCLGIGLFVGLALLSVTASRWLTRGHETHIGQIIMLHDLVAISISADRLLFPQYVLLQGDSLSREQLIAMYDPGDAGRILYGAGLTRHIEYRFQWDQRDWHDLVTVWITSIRSHAPNYLEHRLETFESLFGINREHVCTPYHAGPIWDVPNLLGLTSLGALLYTWVLDGLDTVKNTVLFRGWFYLVLTMAVPLLGFLWKSKNLSGGLALAVSGLGYGLTYFFVSISCEFKYIWWTVLAAHILPVVLLLPSAGTDAATDSCPSTRALNARS